MLTIIISIRAAFSFLTRIPMGSFSFDEKTWRWSTAHFPLVGATLGLLGAAVYFLTAPAGPLVAAASTYAVLALVTGAFHEDGLADTADALGGAFDPDRIKAILKDSRIGSFGAVALTAAFILRVAATAELGSAAPMALIATQCASRLPPVLLMVISPYVTSDAASKSRLVSRAGAPQALVAALWTAALIAGALVFEKISPPEAIAIIASGAICLACLGRLFHRRLKGITGDFLGALQMVSECSMLVGLAWTKGVLS